MPPWLRLVACGCLLSQNRIVAQTPALYPLPRPRSLATPPEASRVGMFLGTTQAPWGAPLTAALAVTDLRIYDHQLATLFPRSQSYYPMDSLRMLQQMRAAAWLTRLRTSTGAGVEGRQLINVAEVAIRAHRDSLAQALMDMRLAQLNGAVTRSVVLAAVVSLFTDVTQEFPRLSRNFPIAERYATQLQQLPVTGYRTRSDSTDVLYRQIDAQCALIRAADVLHAPARMLPPAERVLKLIKRLGVYERRNILLRSYPYREIAIVLASQPNGRARLDSLDARLLDLGALGPSDMNPLLRVPSDSQQRANQLTMWQRTMRDRFASVALLGQHAPPVLAHAWLNTPDSTYADSPRVHATDRRVRVLAFGDQQGDVVPVLERIQQQFPADVEVVLAVQTTGHIGPDIATPAAEVAWLARYYKDKQHVTFSVAIWAGAKVSGLYGSVQPMPSPVGPAYHAAWLSGVCLIDATGVVRVYQEVKTREQEAQLTSHVNALLAEGYTPVHR